MVVDAAIAKSLEGGDRVRLALFVASCTERMAQLFTGLRGPDPSRADDVELYLETLEELWRLDLPSSAFSARMEALQGFVELQPSEEGLVEVGDIYAFYGVLCMRYAVLFRLNGDAGDALRCAHASRSALGQLDRNIPQAAFFEGEGEYQHRSMRFDITAEESILRLRDSDRAVGRERLLAVNSRLRR